MRRRRQIIPHGIIDLKGIIRVIVPLLLVPNILWKFQLSFTLLVFEVYTSTGFVTNMLATMPSCISKGWLSSSLLLSMSYFLGTRPFEVVIKFLTCKQKVVKAVISKWQEQKIGPNGSTITYRCINREHGSQRRDDSSQRYTQQKGNVPSFPLRTCS